MNKWFPLQPKGRGWLVGGVNRDGRDETVTDPHFTQARVLHRSSNRDRIVVAVGGHPLDFDDMLRPVEPVDAVAFRHSR